MKRVTIKIIIGILSFALGAVAAYAVIESCLFFPLPWSVVQDHGDGCTVAFANYTMDKTSWIGYKHGVTVIEINDWKNNAPIKRIVYPSSAEGKIFYSDGDSIIVYVGNNYLYDYNKRTRLVREAYFDLKYQLVDITPDKKNIVAVSNSPAQIVLLDWTGKIVLSHDIIGSAGVGDHKIFDSGNKIAMVTVDERDIPIHLFVWDIKNNQLVENKDKAVVNGLLHGYLEMFSNDPAVYLEVQNGESNKRIKL